MLGPHFILKSIQHLAMIAMLWYDGDYCKGFLIFHLILFGSFSFLLCQLPYVELLCVS